MAVDGPTKKYIIKAGNVVPQHQGENDGNDSDRSSICHSPGWDDLSGNKKKKEKQAAKDKKKAELKKLETEAKHATKMKNRLSKAPPTNHHFNKIANPMDRSTSSPGILTLADSTKTSPAKEGPPKSKGTRSRRGSIDAGIKSFFSATQALPSLFSKSSHSTPASAVTPRESTSPTNNASNAFTGGLKLRMSEEAAVQDKARYSMSAALNDRTSPSDGGNPNLMGKGAATNYSPATSKVGNSSDKFPRSHPKKESPQDDNVRTPQQWDDIYMQAGRMVANGNGGNPNRGSVTDNVKHRNTHQSAQSLSSGYANIPNDMQSYDSPGSSGRDSSRASKFRFSRPGTSEDTTNYSTRGSSPHSVDKKSPKSRKHSVDSANGHVSQTYVQSQRMQRNDRGMAAFQDEYKDRRSTDSAVVRRSSSFHSTKSRASIDATDIASGPLSGNHPSTATASELKEDFAIFSDYKPPALYLDDLSPSSEGLTPRDDNPNSLGGLKGLRVASKSPFSRSPTASPIAHSFVSSNFDVDIRPASQRAATLPLMEGISHTGAVNKPEVTLGEFVPSAQVSPQSLHSPSTFDASLKRTREVGPVEVNHRQGAGASSHTRTATDSSEDSNLEEFSNLTTPMASRPHSQTSRPQSQKDYFPQLSEITLKAPKAKPEPVKTPSSTPKKSKKAAILSGPIPLRPYENENGQQDGWSRTPLPSELEEAKRIQASNPKRSFFRSSAAPTMPVPPVTSSSRQSAKLDPAKESKSASALQRQLSLSRSASTPELQDLSFLPVLKHQPLTKPTNKKEKTSSSNKKGKQPAPPQDPVTRDLIKSPPILLSSPASEGSSPLSPSGGAYLRDARMSLPHLPSSSQKSPKQIRFSNIPSSQLASPGLQSEPMAKMFVVCCSCKYFHDMPSKIYECMARPDNVVEDRDLGVSGVISTSVKCPWCAHGMSTDCCAGYAAVVYLREKLH
ncbi:hypothetical protein GLAREA_03722 [Glarea lozoyensis ATCC 20868]|uniref:Uncharacterized protein n=1 Tax=Glarea lozoyensis (strain ATCC 20868 / MF5171) TaxID=1116229 RepID=S3CYV1_GLAL2|nr:uncharacterized protein GLAREA_03722 [Glarea lozoyensis ATCC 20868]EPE30755.1 hypothetical protein GLAREA_03722 [Glarea lozoyensis ATCC 20868]